MWTTALIAGGLFVAMLVMLWLNFEDAEKRRGAEGEGPVAVGPGQCLLCDAPLRQRRTREEVVGELEHRIDADLQDIERQLRTSPDRLEGLYRSERGHA
jgi:hypothetical protein